MWQAWTGHGLESLRVSVDADGVRAESVAIGLSAGRAYTVRYALRCDTGWRVRTLEAWTLGDAHASLALSSDGSGRWTGPDGAHRPSLDGCFDVDFPSTAFTNTLPIRRLELVAGGVREIAVVYVRAPALSVELDHQRYICVEPRRRYRYEAVDGTFAADIEVDGDGLVLTYPGLFRRRD